MTFCNRQRTCGKGLERPSSSVRVFSWHEHIVFSVRKILWQVWYFSLFPVGHTIPCSLDKKLSMPWLQALKSAATLQPPELVSFFLSPLPRGLLGQCHATESCKFKFRGDPNLRFKNDLWPKLFSNTQGKHRFLCSHVPTPNHSH